MLLLLERIIIITVFVIAGRQAAWLAESDLHLSNAGGRKRREVGKLELESLSFTACGVV